MADRWPLERALLGGARVDDARGAPPQRERGRDYVAVLVSSAFAGVPWLERVHQAESLWDGAAMGAPLQAHCYTPAEYERRLASLRPVRAIAERGIDLLG